jgi:hypothetical protein
MTEVQRRRFGALLVAGLGTALTAVTLAGCGSERMSQERLEREESLNVYPGNYRADLVAALHAYLSNPANIRDAWVAEPAITPIGPRKRYAACVRFNARDSDGRYAGSKDVLAVFASGRFDQFIEPPVDPASQGNATSFVKELCDKAEYKRFPELEAMKR